MTNSINTISASNIDGIISIGKLPGAALQNCRFVSTPADLPEFLVEDRAVEVTENGVSMWSVDGEEASLAHRPFPFFLKWEKASIEKRSVLERELEDGTVIKPKYGTWPKDNGFETLTRDENGTCFDLAPVMKAAILSEELPSFCDGVEVTREGNRWAVTNSWGEIRSGEIEKAFWVEYKPGDVNIVAVSEPSAAEYYLYENGVRKERLIDLL